MQVRRRDRSAGQRACLNCGRDFESEGVHHRICRPCKRVRGRDDPEPEVRFDCEASRKRREQGLRRLMDLPLRKRGLARFLIGADLTFRTCQWIAGDPSANDGCKCGRPTVGGSPYCTYHRDRARPPPPVPVVQRRDERAA